MSAGAARDVLWRWLEEAVDPDPEQHAWKLATLEGILLACERTGVLSTDELTRWRALIDGGAAAVPAGADRGAAEAFLASTLEAVQPMTREADPERIRAASRFDGALDALAEVGVISEDDRSTWHQRELSASAPWLPGEEVEEIAGFDGAVAVSIPATTDEERAADEASQHEHERLARRGALRRVITVGAPERHAGLALFAVLAREESTDVLFHLVGPPQGEFQGGFAEMEAYRELTDALVPPSLTDDAHTVYEPVRQGPAATTGTGGVPDPEQPRVVTGFWRYVPGAPASATEFVATADGARWVISAA